MIAAYLIYQAFVTDPVLGFVLILGLIFGIIAACVAMVEKRGTPRNS
jgi:hypothetical protein